LGLRADYELLAQLEDPLGLFYQEWQQRLLDVLGHRNASILAHGLDPITHESWEHMWQITSEYVEKGLQILGAQSKAPQFPSWHNAVPREA
jgi:hypothetical protein